LSTDTFDLLHQFQLLINTQAISLNGGAGGLNLAGSLGVTLQSTTGASHLSTGGQLVSNTNTLSVDAPNV